MTKYGVVRTDNMYGTDVRAGLVSVRYMGASGDTATAIENGSVVKIDALEAGEREVYVAKDVAANEALADVVLIAAPEVAYDERIRNFDEFINEAGKAVRGYRFHVGDTFSVTKEALTGAASPKVGDIVELAAGTKMNVVTSATSGSTVIGSIIAVEVAGRYTYYVIKVKPVAATTAAVGDDLE